MISNTKSFRKSESGNAVVIVLVVLVVAAVGALAYLSSQMSKDESGEKATIAAAEPASGAEEAVKTASAAGEGTNTSTPAGTEVKPGNPVVAKVGDVEVTRLDVFNYIQTLPPQMRQAPLEQIFALAQDQVISSKLMESKVDTKALEGDEEVQKQLDTAKAQIMRNVFIQRAINEKMTDKRLEKAYEAYKKEFPKVDEVKARHILVADEAKAKELISKLNDGGDFAELAKENSTDGTAQTGGDLGFFAKADVVPEFAEVAFELKKDTYTKEPVKTQFGYHVIKKEDMRKRPVPEFEQTKPFLESNLRRDILNELMDEWKKDAKIERFDINGDPVKEAESN